jgi:hypothetical protein
LTRIACIGTGHGQKREGQKQNPKPGKYPSSRHLNLLSVD